MAEERITTRSTPDGRTTHTTITSDAPRSGGGMGWVFGLVLLVLVGIGIYYFSQQSESEATMNNAVAGAAQDVGDAAQTAGDAAKQSADSFKQ